jgi:hypothetical protein
VRWKYVLIEFNGKMYNMNGIYKVFIDGELIAEQKNKLTLLGRSNALKTMLGLVPSFAGSMGIGISSKSNGTTNQYLDMADLDFSVGRYPITAASLGQNDQEDVLVYTARITDTSRYYITEIGLYSNKLSSNFEADNRTIFNFESGDPLKEIVSSNTYYLDDINSTYVAGKATAIMSDRINYRIGNNAVKITGTSKSIFFNDSVSDLGYVAPYDQFVLAAYFSNSTSCSVVFASGAASATYTFTGTTNAYNVMAINKNTPTSSSGTVDWNKIDTITINFSDSDGYVILDGLRVKKYKTLDSVEGLVSRAVFTTTGDNPTAIEKPLGSVIDIQYLLEMQMDM